MSNVINGLVYGLPVFAIGIFIVFLALVIIIVAITVLSKIVGAASKKEAPAPVAAPAPAPAPVEEPVVEEGVDEELIAVIAAAIAAFDQTGAKLVVRSVRRKGAWGKASREEQVYRF